MYTTGEGLSQSSVYHIRKDRDGYVWVGTGDGLNKLTTRSIEVFKQDLDHSSVPSANAVRSLFCDDAGNTWVGSDDGLKVFPFGADEPMDRIGDVPLPKVFCIPVGEYRDRLIGWHARHGVFAMNPHNGHITETYPVQAELAHYDGKMLALSGRELWLAKGMSRLVEIDLETAEQRELAVPTYGRRGIPKVNQVEVISEHVYVAADSTLWLYRKASGGWTALNSFGGRVLSFAIVNGVEIWVGILGVGLQRLDMEGNPLEPVRPRLSVHGRGDLDLHTVSEIYSADDGLVWLGVEGAGAVSVHVGTGFRKITKDDPYVPGLTHSFIRSLAVQDENSLLVGTYLGGAFLLELDKGKFTPLRFPATVGSDVYALFPHSRDMLLAATETGLWMLRRSGEARYEPLTHLLNHRCRQAVRWNGGVVVATERGLYRFSPEKGGPPELVMDGDVFHLFAGDGELWCTTSMGVFVFDEEGNPLRSDSGYAAYGMRSTHISESGEVWASSKNGLLELHPQNLKILRRYGKKEGLPDDYVYGVVESGGLLWGSTHRGLFALDPRTDYVRTYHHRDGLQSNEFNGRCFLRMPDGRLVFGGVGGLNIFRGEETAPPPVHATIHLSRLWINDAESDLSRLQGHLKSMERNFVFEWDVLEWANPDKVQLQVKLAGVDSGWTTLGEDNRIRYTALPPGQYALYTRSKGANGYVQEEALASEFRISPPFYREWWFSSSAVLLGISLFTLVIQRISTAKYRRKLLVFERQKQMDQLRRRIARDIHDDVGSDLSKIKMLLSKSASETGEGHYERIAELSERALNGLSEVVWTVNSEYDRLPRMVAWFRAYAYGFLEEGDMQVRFTAPDRIPEFLIEPDLRRNLLMIYKESLNNILKHSGASVVTVRFSCSEQGGFRLEITDDGVGFDREGHHSGAGLKNLERRADESGLTAEIRSEPGRGTTVVIVGELAGNYHEKGKTESTA